jgi:transposase
MSCTDRSLSAPTVVQNDPATVFVALELSHASWLVAANLPGGDQVSKHGLEAGNGPALLARLKAAAERRCGGPARVVTIQEAGMVRPPSPEAEDARRPSRERQALLQERIRHTNRIKGLLCGQGIVTFKPLRRDRRERLDELRTGDGRPLPPHLKAEIVREITLLETILDLLAEVEAERDALATAALDTVTPVPTADPSPSDTLERSMPETAPPPPAAVPADGARAMALLLKLKGIGAQTAAVLGLEAFSRRFDNRRQVAAYAGLAPCPFQSGGTDREQGLSKAGNGRLRHAMGELAWLWIRYQPDSALSRWFHDRVGANRGRIRRILITTVARRLLIALWRYVTQGVVPAGATLKP